MNSLYLAMIISTCLSLYILWRRDCMEGLNFEKMSEIFNDISVFPFKALFDTRVDKMSAVYC